MGSGTASASVRVVAESRARVAGRQLLNTWASLRAQCVVLYVIQHFNKINTGFLNRSGISHQAAMGWQELAVI